MSGLLLTKMETENSKETGEIEPLLQDPMDEPKSEINPNPNPTTVKARVPEVEIRLYRQGKGPIDVFKSSLGGWDQNQLEVRDILDKYGLKSIYAFSPQSGRGVPIRFHPRNGRSILGYKDGSVVHIDGEPQVISNFSLLTILGYIFASIFYIIILLILS